VSECVVIVCASACVCVRGRWGGGGGAWVRGVWVCVAEGCGCFRAQRFCTAATLTATAAALVLALPLFPDRVLSVVPQRLLTGRFPVCHHKRAGTRFPLLQSEVMLHDDASVVLVATAEQEALVGCFV
jgi:hypothetical protein